MTHRTPIVAANWKMHTTASEARELLRATLPRLASLDGIERVVCPPFPWLLLAAEELQGTSVKLGAQNVHWEEKGAFTGEVSPVMLRGLCEYVIIGHSERRHIFGETDQMINAKIKAALVIGLKPIFCVGETLEEREAGRTEQVLVAQVRQGLEGVPDLPSDFVIAYEPVWAIGTGRAATVETAAEAIGIIRWEIASLFGEDKGQSVRVQYGGSVSPDNIAQFVSHPDIDGALVGGASLNAVSFVSIVEQTYRAKASTA